MYMGDLDIYTLQFALENFWLVTLLLYTTYNL